MAVWHFGEFAEGPPARAINYIGGLTDSRIVRRSTVRCPIVRVSMRERLTTQAAYGEPADCEGTIANAPIVVVPIAIAPKDAAESARCVGCRPNRFSNRTGTIQSACRGSSRATPRRNEGHAYVPLNGVDWG
jgi:hypothetical protein